MTIDSPTRATDIEAIRQGVRELCARFPATYWRDLDRRSEYPEEFIRAMTAGGWLSVLIPEEYGGAGLGISEGSVILEEINRSGGHAAPCHAQMYIMGTLLRHGNEEQKRRYLPKVAAGDLRLQSFGVTEPNAGSDTTRIQTRAVLKGDRYIINGQKIFISRFQHSDLMLLLTRTTPYEEVKNKTEGMSVFLVDIKAAGKAIEARKLDMMLNHETNELFINDLEVPVENLIGEEGKGFRYLLDGLNAERILVSAGSIGSARWCVAKAAKYASERVVFGRPIGANQGVQFPIARAHVATEAADLMRWRAATLFDAKQRCGAEANMAKYLSSEAAMEAADACIDAHGGYGFAVEYDIERVFRSSRLSRTAPINNNLVLAFIGEHVLGMPKSY
jgi:acyl-CoA dehydrogenase